VTGDAFGSFVTAGIQYYQSRAGRKGIWGRG